MATKGTLARTKGGSIRGVAAIMEPAQPMPTTTSVEVLLLITHSLEEVVFMRIQLL
jgi:hypothetical protein